MIRNGFLVSPADYSWPDGTDPRTIGKCVGGSTPGGADGWRSGNLERRVVPPGQRRFQLRPPTRWFKTNDPFRSHERWSLAFANPPGLGRMDSLNLAMTMKSGSRSVHADILCDTRSPSIIPCDRKLPRVSHAPLVPGLVHGSPASRSRSPHGPGLRVQ